jgi:hypothetical protein
MADTIFRTKVTHETQTTKPIKVTEKTDEVVTANVEPPYTEYATIHNHPFTVDISSWEIHGRISMGDLKKRLKRLKDILNGEFSKENFKTKQKRLKNI